MLKPKRKKITIKNHQTSASLFLVPMRFKKARELLLTFQASYWRLNYCKRFFSVFFRSFQKLSQSQSNKHNDGELMTINYVTDSLFQHSYENFADCLAKPLHSVFNQTLEMLEKKVTMRTLKTWPKRMVFVLNYKIHIIKT